MENLRFLVRISTEERINEFQKEGLLYCNTLDYFAKYESSDRVRGDRLETAFHFERLTNQVLFIKDVYGNFNPIGNALSGQIITHYHDFGNIFCMFAPTVNDIKKTEEPSSLVFDDRFHQFGDTCCIISDMKEFLNRLDNCLEQECYEYERHIVEYVNLSMFDGFRQVYQKDESYSWQKEFRIFIRSNSHKPIQIKLGDLSDISIVRPLNYCNDNNFYVKRTK